MTASSGRRSVALWASGCLVLVIVVAVTAFGGSTPALAFRQAGHWVYNSTVGAVFHVDGGSKTVDNRMSLPGLGPANQVVQDDQHGYVVDRRNGRVLVFGKSTLSVDGTLSVGTSEEPVSLETPGGPYLVYPDGGRIIRLGQPPATITAREHLQTPVSTSDGTVWVRLAKSGALCQLGRQSRSLHCGGSVPADHRGSLTVIDDRPAFVDTTANTIAMVGEHGPETARSLGVTLAPDAQVAGADAGGRLPVVTADNADRHAPPSLMLLDTSTVALKDSPAKPPARAISVPLQAGHFDTPMTSGGAIAVVDQTAHQILTYTNQGARKATTALPASAGRAELSRGEDGRVYIDTATGSRTFVVDGDGSVTSVTDDGDNRNKPPTSSPAPTKPPVAPPSTPTKSAGPQPTPTAKPSPTASPKPTTHRAKPAPRPTPTKRPPSPKPKPKPRPTPTPTQAPTTPVPTQVLPPTQPVVPVQPEPTMQAPPTQQAPVQPTQPPAAKPGAPGNVTAKAGDGTATVSWTVPATDGGAPITGYQISARNLSGGRTEPINVPRNRNSAPMGALRNGQTYVFTVSAVNRAGVGPGTQSSGVTPNPALTAPGDVTAKANPDGTVAVSWAGSPATSDGAVSYTVNASGGHTVPVKGETHTVVTGLNVGRPYNFTVTATANGKSLASAPVGPITPYKPAAAPTGLTATPGVGKVTLKWAAPALNGGKLVKYIAGTASGSAQQATTATTAEITHLSAGKTFTFTVRAITQDPNGGGGAQVQGAAAAAIQSGPIPPPKATIESAVYDSDSGYLVIHVHMDTGGVTPTTCAVTLDAVVIQIPLGQTYDCSQTESIIPINVGKGDGDDDDKGNGAVGTVSVTPTNAVGTGPPSAPAPVQQN